ncbi:hypothetical protein THAOC_25781, partial [Thalassiosira oceanica]
MGAAIGPPGEAMEELDSPYHRCAGRADRADGSANFGPFLYLALLLTIVLGFDLVIEFLRYAGGLAWKPIGKESSDELLLYFSSDGGESFYNEDDPRVATRASEDEIHSRRAEVCTTSSSCGADGSRCFYGGGDSCSDCCSGVHGTSKQSLQEEVKGSLSDHTCTCMPSFPRLFQEYMNPGATCCVNDGAECKSDYWDPGSCNFVGDGCCSGFYWAGGCCSGTIAVDKDFKLSYNTMVGKPSRMYCGTCLSSGIRCGYENQWASDTGCVKKSHGLGSDWARWEFPAYYIGEQPIGRGMYDKCCSGVKMTTEIGKESSDELLLYFSSDGGESFYNEHDPPVATRASEDEIHSRRAEYCIA